MLGDDAMMVPDPAANWSQAWKLRSLHDDFRPRVLKVIRALLRQRFRPVVIHAWRSLADQEELFRQGRTAVRFSFHNAQRMDGTPCACAADVVDARWGWSEEAQANGFWAALGLAAKQESLHWGGDWTELPDLAHIQLYPNSRLQQVRAESGL